nr:hypothetical protein [Paenibacillus validus]
MQHVSTQGDTPRNFALTPDGRFLAAPIRTPAPSDLQSARLTGRWSRQVIQLERQAGLYLIPVNGSLSSRSLSKEARIRQHWEGKQIFRESEKHAAFSSSDGRVVDASPKPGINDR